MQRWVALTLIIASGCDSLTGRPAMLRALERGCEEGKKNKSANEQKLQCSCLIEAITRDFTDTELRVAATDAKFFTEEEMNVLVRRKATDCLKPVAVAGCGGKASCVCVVQGLFDEYEGDALWDIVERYQQGRPIPVEFSAVVSRCQSKK
jgi:hypothetical protein